MHDFAAWATAAEPGLGLPPGSFMAAYRRNIGQARVVVLEGLGEKIIALAETGFEGSATELARRLEEGDTQREAKRVSNSLRQLEAALAEVGVTVERFKAHGAKSVIRIRREQPALAG
jgi:hypothetical protein